MFSNIPVELQRLNQWVCAGPDKKPLNPRTGQAADVTDPSTWGTFDEAARCGYKHIGFVLSKSDPYCIIDLDDPANEDQATRHSAIVKAFDSYTELSQSGAGLHIIIKGKLPKGARRDKVEIYSDDRYMICTGNVFKAMPIVEYQEVLQRMFDQMNSASPAIDLVQIDGHMSDEEVYNMASGAANADKFARLWAGQIEEWPSQSEADFALLSMLAFYSKDNEQVRRVFRYSALGKREKAVRNDKYLNIALGKIRAKEPKALDFSNLTAATSEAISHVIPQAPRVPIPEEKKIVEPGASIPLPPGFIGELAQYFYASAIRPVKDIALATAIGLTAGIVGRSYNISGTGLNQYIILLAKTGSGKEGIATAIDAMVSAVSPQVPMVNEFIGPGAFASGQALIRVLDKEPCFVSVLGEFGLTLQQLCDPKANSAQVILKKVLLDIYAKSGFTKVLRSSVYSEAEKNTKIVQAPNVTILGEATPESFYDGLDSAAIAQGLIPRFSIFEYEGPRPPRNRHAFSPPPSALTDSFAALLAVALSSKQNRVHCPIQVDAESTRRFDAFDEQCDDRINSSDGDVSLQLWNRAHLKALKLAGLVAVGINPHQPTVTIDCAEWAIMMTERDIEKLMNKFVRGDVGQGDTRMESDLRRVALAYLSMKPKLRAEYRTPKALLEAPVIPIGFLRRRLRGLRSFREDRRGANAALSATIKSMIEAGELAQMPPLQAQQEFGVSSPLYAIGANW